MTEFNDVVEKYNYIVTQMPEKNKFYHLKSVENFLKHFNEIIDKKKREEILELLNEYLDYITANNVNSVAECRNLFFNFIHPVGTFYKEHLGFSYLIRPDSIIVYLVICNIVFLLFTKIFYYYIALNSIGLIFYYLMYRKSKSTRTYRFNW